MSGQDAAAAVGSGHRHVGLRETADLPMTSIMVVFMMVSGTVVAFGLIAGGAWWMVRAGIEGGDLPGDAASRLTIGADGRPLISVRNPSNNPVMVGAHVRAESRFAIRNLTPSLVVRPARRLERRGGVGWTDTILGTVSPGVETTWPVPVVGGRTRLLVAIGQSEGRLRIHDHLVRPPEISVDIQDGPRGSGLSPSA
jgi:hypothetical protein